MLAPHSRCQRECLLPAPHMLSRCHVPVPSAALSGAPARQQHRILNVFRKSSLTPQLVRTRKAVTFAPQLHHARGTPNPPKGTLLQVTPNSLLAAEQSPGAATWTHRALCFLCFRALLLLVLGGRGRGGLLVPQGHQLGLCLWGRRIEQGCGDTSKMLGCVAWHA